MCVAAPRCECVSLYDSEDCACSARTFTRKKKKRLDCVHQVGIVNVTGREELRKLCLTWLGHM